MATLEPFAPSLSFFDALYGPDMDQFPVSLDCVFHAAEGGESLSLPCRCRCTVSEGSWVRIPAEAGEDWVQIPLAGDVKISSMLE